MVIGRRRRRRLHSYATITTAACAPNPTTTTFPGLWPARRYTRGERVCIHRGNNNNNYYLFVYNIKINVFFSYQTVETGLLPLMNALLRAYAVHAAFRII